MIAGDILYCSSRPNEAIDVRLSGLELDIAKHDKYVPAQSGSIFLETNDEKTYSVYRDHLLKGRVYSKVRFRVMPYNNPTATRPRTSGAEVTW